MALVFATYGRFLEWFVQLFLGPFFPFLGRRSLKECPQCSLTFLLLVDFDFLVSQNRWQTFDSSFCIVQEEHLALSLAFDGRYIPMSMQKLDAISWVTASTSDPLTLH
jgi:hypothetical protein